MVSVWAGPFTGSDGGQTLTMVGVWLATVTLTVMLCDLVVTIAPEATIVILPVYGIAVGASDVASTVTVRVDC